MDYKTKDTIEKENFPTGAQRNDPSGKGRYVLISPIALRRIAGVYERGSLAKGVRNWELGLPISRCLDSAIRHIYQYIEGLRDEDHLAQAAWNLCASIHMEEMVERGRLPKELNDMPNYLPLEKSPFVHLVGKNIRCHNGQRGKITQFEKSSDGSIIVWTDKDPHPWCCESIEKLPLLMV